MHMFRNSGKDYNDFGRYEDCETYHDFNYYMLTVVQNKFPIPFTMGLCMPGVCSLADLNSYKSTFVDTINTAIPNLFENVKGFDVEATITADDLLIVKSTDENLKVTKFDSVTAIVTMTIAFFALATLVCSFILGSQSPDYKQNGWSNLSRHNLSPQRQSSSSSSSGGGQG